MKGSFLTIAIIIVILAVGGWFTYKALNPEENAKNSEAARALVGDEKIEVTNYTDLQGNPVELQEYAGRIRVVNSWASWSPFSRDELNDLENLASNNDVVVIAINRAETAAKVRSYLNKIGDFNNVIFILDPDDRFYKSVGGYAMPETIFYDETGQVFHHNRGVMDMTKMQDFVDQMLNREEE